jgi:hypothetical protein
MFRAYRKKTVVPLPKTKNEMNDLFEEDQLRRQKIE